MSDGVDLFCKLVKIAFFRAGSDLSSDIYRRREQGFLKETMMHCRILLHIAENIFLAVTVSMRLTGTMALMHGSSIMIRQVGSAAFVLS